VAVEDAQQQPLLLALQVVHQQLKAVATIDTP
jgi:hypothetical protein